MSDLFSGTGGEVREGLERWGWRRLPASVGGFAWKDAHGNLYTEDQARAHWERKQKEEGR